jgi:hypothetical protein
LNLLLNKSFSLRVFFSRQFVLQPCHFALFFRGLFTRLNLCVFIFRARRIIDWPLKNQNLLKIIQKSSSIEIIFLPDINLLTLFDKRFDRLKRLNDKLYQISMGSPNSWFYRKQFFLYLNCKSKALKLLFLKFS